MACPYCTIVLQRTHDGTEKDGLLEHIKVVLHSYSGAE